jgi:hypothetical protein
MVEANKVAGYTGNEAWRDFRTDFGFPTKLHSVFESCSELWILVKTSAVQATNIVQTFILQDVGCVTYSTVKAGKPAAQTSIKIKYLNNMQTINNFS